MTTPIGSITDGSTVDPGTIIRGESDNQNIDKSQFLLLFVEQLKNQDPLSPMSPDDLTAQLAQFSSLEQLTGINERLDELNGGTKHQLSTTLLGMLGRTVRVEGNRLTLADGDATAIGYELPEAADAVTITVRDSAGAVVRTIDAGAQSAGAQTFEFDGKSKYGVDLPDGTYTVSVAATPVGGDEDVFPTLTMEGVVDGVDLSADPPTLTVGGVPVTLDDVREVRTIDDDDDA